MVDGRMQKSKKSKRPDLRPARSRYWRSHMLEERKISNLVKYNDLTRPQAEKKWYSERTRYYGLEYSPSRVKA